jgi:hypothetical protein
MSGHRSRLIAFGAAGGADVEVTVVIIARVATPPPEVVVVTGAM